MLIRTLNQSPGPENTVSLDYFRQDSLIETVLKNVADIYHLFSLIEEIPFPDRFCIEEHSLPDNIQKIGEGGLGYIFSAEWGSKKYAIKIGKQASFLHRKLFKNEAKLQHESAELRIAPKVILNSSDKLSGRPYLLMEFVEGATLTDYVEMETDGKKILEKFVILAAKLDRLHKEKGIVHRDVKLENVIVNGDVHLIDYGLSKHLDDKDILFSSQVGTMKYMAPELFNNQLDFQSDQYNLGMSLYFALTGLNPFSGTMDWGMVAKKFNLSIYPLQIREKFEKKGKLADIINKCIEPLPENRFPACVDVAAELYSCL
ncbi:MAG: serine/threonine-protein kinase [Candidatus Woesearchaeota archaeon]